MAKQKLRTIVINGVNYLWAAHVTYQRLDETQNYYRRVDTFDAYAASNRTSRLRIVFLAWDDGNVSGGNCVFVDGTSENDVNFHTPKWAAILIRAGLAKGWQPTAHAMPLTIANGVELLVTLGYLPPDRSQLRYH